MLFQRMSQRRNLRRSTKSRLFLISICSVIQKAINSLNFSLSIHITCLCFQSKLQFFVPFSNRFSKRRAQIRALPRWFTTSSWIPPVRSILHSLRSALPLHPRLESKISNQLPINPNGSARKILFQYLGSTKNESKAMNQYPCDRE